MYHNMRISPSAKEGIDWLKQAFNFKTYNDCILSIEKYFKSNNISPRDSFGSNNFSKSISELRQDIFLKLSEVVENVSLQSERVINNSKEVEQGILKPMKDNVADIHYQSMAVKAKKNEELEKISDLEKKIFSQDITIRKLNNIIEQQELKIQEYHKCLSTLKSLISQEKSLTSKKVVINSSFEEVSRLFYLLI